VFLIFSSSTLFLISCAVRENEYHTGSVFKGLCVLHHLAPLIAILQTPETVGRLNVSQSMEIVEFDILVY
jgi:hypothetical protein